MLQFLQKYISSFFFRKLISFNPPLRLDRWTYDMEHEPCIQRYMASGPLQLEDIDGDSMDLCGLRKSLKLDDKTQFFFHGTSVDSANLICEEGASKRFGLRNLDFNTAPAFYVTTSLKYARLQCWRSMVMYGNRYGIVVFAVPDWILHGDQFFHLKFTNASAVWKKVVTQCRRTDNSGYSDIISGPVCINGAEVSKGKESPLSNQDVQTCFRTHKAVEELNKCIVGVMYGDISQDSKRGRNSLLLENYTCQ